MFNQIPRERSPSQLSRSNSVKSISAIVEAEDLKLSSMPHSKIIKGLLKNSKFNEIMLSQGLTYDDFTPLLQL